MAVPHGAGSFALQGPRPVPPKMEGLVYKGWDFLGIFKLILCEGMVEWLVCFTNLEMDLNPCFLLRPYLHLI